MSILFYTNRPITTADVRVSNRLTTERIWRMWWQRPNAENQDTYLLCTILLFLSHHVTTGQNPPTRNSTAIVSVCHCPHLPWLHILPKSVWWSIERLTTPCDKMEAFFCKSYSWAPLNSIWQLVDCFNCFFNLPNDFILQIICEENYLVLKTVLFFIGTEGGLEKAIKSHPLWITLSFIQLDKH